MSIKSIIDDGGAKLWANLSLNNADIQGITLSKKTATAINTTGAITGSQALGGIITSTTGAAVTLTFANGQASALYVLMGSPSTGASFQCNFVNLGGSNALTVASSDANLSVAGVANSGAIAANSARLLTFVVTNSATPAITVYG